MSRILITALFFVLMACPSFAADQRADLYPVLGVPGTTSDFLMCWDDSSTLGPCKIMLNSAPDYLLDGTGAWVDWQAKMDAKENKLNCSTIGQVKKWNGSAWECGADNEGSGTLPILEEGQIIIGDTDGTPIAVTPKTLVEGDGISIETVGDNTTISATSSGIVHTTSETPEDGACTWNTSDYKLRCRTGDDVYVSGEMTFEATLDTTPPTANTFAMDATGLELSFSTSETATVDCTLLTATWATAGTISNYTGTSSPCTSATPVYSGDTGTIAGAEGFLTDTAINESVSFSGVSIDNTSNTALAGTPQDGDVFNEGWFGGTENVGSYVDTVGTGGTITEDYTLTGTPPDGSLSKGLLTAVTTGGTNTYRRIDVGTGAIPTVDFYFEFKVNSVVLPSDNDQIYILGFADTDNAVQLDGSYRLYKQSGVIKLFSSMAGLQAIANQDTNWHTLHVHIDSTAANSYTKLDSNTPITFTAAAFNPRYIFLGPVAMAGSTRSVSVEWGRMWVNTP